MFFRNWLQCFQKSQYTLHAVSKSIFFLSWLPDQTLSQANQNYYDRSGQYQLSSDDAAFLSEDLRNALIPFKLVQITGDLGEGKKDRISDILV